MTGMYAVGDRVNLFPFYSGTIVYVQTSLPDLLGKTEQIYSVQLDNGTSITAKAADLVREA